MSTRKLTFTIPNYAEFQRYMFVFSGVNNTDGQSAFQLNEVAIKSGNTWNSGFTYITGAPSNNADNYITNVVDGNIDSRWYTSGLATTSMGYCIFDASDKFIPNGLGICDGPDTLSITGRHPRAYGLYASSGTPTTSGDESWVNLYWNSAGSADNIGNKTWSLHTFDEPTSGGQTFNVQYPNNRGLTFEE